MKKLHGAVCCLSARIGIKVDGRWCFEPDYQFDLGIVTNPKLLPLLVRERVKQTVVFPMPPGAESTLTPPAIRFPTEVPID